MKTLGFIGGISWVSTLDYYKYINQEVNKRLGGLSAAEMYIYSVNYQRIVENNERGDWDATLNIIAEGCKNLEHNGAEAILLGANTMHMIAEPLQQKLKIPIIHIAEVTAEAIKRKGISRVSLLGTRFTMEENFFRDILTKHGIQSLIPPRQDREFIHQTISTELGRNIFTDATRERYIKIIEELGRQGAEGTILGCTEIPMLVQQDHVTPTVFDTVHIHSMAAVDFILS